MALKFKSTFGPGVTPINKSKIRLQKFRRGLQKKGLMLKRLSSGAFDVQKIKKGPSVKTPRKTSRGVSF